MVYSLPEETCPRQVRINHGEAFEWEDQNIKKRKTLLWCLKSMAKDHNAKNCQQ